MLKITNIEEKNQLRVVIEGKLVAPWLTELKRACEQAQAQLSGRKLVVDVQWLSAISPEAENVLLDLLNEGVKLCGSGLFTRQILKQLVRRRRQNSEEKTI